MPIRGRACRYGEVFAYAERHPLRAGLLRRAEDWRRELPRAGRSFASAEGVAERLAAAPTAAMDDKGELAAGPNGGENGEGIDATHPAGRPKVDAPHGGEIIASAHAAAPQTAGLASQRKKEVQSG